VNEEEARSAFEQVMKDPYYAAQFTVGCVLTLSVVQLVKGGMAASDVHDIIDITLQYGLPDEKKVLTVWVYLLAYSAQKMAEMGASVDEVHQTVDVNLRQIEAVQAGAQE
jgi:hypothetical protein